MILTDFVLNIGLGDMKLQYTLLLISSLMAGSGYDHGTAAGKGNLDIALTWNPGDQIEFGQTYVVFSYGITGRMDIHGYVSHHTEGHETWYTGIFYQFLKFQSIDMATAVGIRRQFDQNWTHLFFPQVLYTLHLNEKIYVGGSFVNLKDISLKENLGVAIDIAFYYMYPYKSDHIKAIYIGLGGFHPVTYDKDQYFLPTYSLDFKF